MENQYFRIFIIIIFKNIKIDSMKLPMLIVYILAISLTSTLSMHPQQMNQQIIQQLKVQEDYIHHFVFFNQEVFHQLKQKYGKYINTQIQGKSNQFIYKSILEVKFYLNDCKSVPMKQCHTKDSIPLMLLFNRIFIRFNGGNSQNQLQQIYRWMKSRLSIQPKQITDKQALQQKLNQTPELVCYCNKVAQEKALFYSLSKAMILTSYCILDNKTLCTELGLKEGNVTIFKNGTLEHRIQYEYPNRYDMWQNFVKIYTLTHVKRANQVMQKRFTQQNKTIDTTILVCDFSYKCEQLWLKFQVLSRQFQKNNPQIDLRIAFIDPKQALLFDIYLHTSVNLTRLPALLNIKLLSTNQKAGYIRRYLDYPQRLDQSYILQFIKNVQDGKVQEIFKSAQIPQKNGFTGKASQKLVQKLVAKNLNQTIQKSQKHYLLLLSTMGVGCSECEEFYKQYKKAASFLVDQDITLGFMDVQSNQVRIDNVKSIPQVLLYNKYFKNDPQRMSGRQNFDNLLRFLENNAIINYSTDL